MDDWREHVSRGAWENIDIYRLSQAERAELLECLKRIVPRRDRGHGIETFEGFIPPHEAKSWAEYEAAFLAQRLERLLHRDDRHDYFHPMAEPVRLAIATIEASGIRYEGWRKTYLYWHPAREQWAQLPSKIGAAIWNKREQMLFSVIDIPDDEIVNFVRKKIAWEQLYPWRRCLPLHLLFKWDQFEPATPFFHALRILDWYDGFKEIFDRNRLDRHPPRFDRLANLLHTAECAIEIGRSYEALIKKPFEPHAIRGFKSLESARLGAEMRRENFGPRTREIVRMMETLVDRGHSVANAARLTARRGIGESEGANRALWYRHGPKKL